MTTNVRYDIACCMNSIMLNVSPFNVFKILVDKLITDGRIYRNNNLAVLTQFILKCNRYKVNITTDHIIPDIINDNNILLMLYEEYIRNYCLESQLNVKVKPLCSEIMEIYYHRLLKYKKSLYNKVSRGIEKAFKKIDKDKNISNTIKSINDEINNRTKLLEENKNSLSSEEKNIFCINILLGYAILKQLYLKFLLYKIDIIYADSNEISQMCTKEFIKDYQPETSNNSYEINKYILELRCKNL